MKSKEEIENNIEATFNSLAVIEEVKVNHFFKHKVLQKLQSKKEDKPNVLGWFTPKLQLAFLGLVILLNVSTIWYAFKLQEKNTEVTIETFAQDYGLQTKTISILN